MRRIVISILFATVAGALTVGAAATLAVTTGGLGSGEADVKSCDEDVVDVTWDLVPNEPQLVAGVTVTGISEDCAGQSIYVVVQGSIDEASTVLATANGDVTGAFVSLEFGVDNEVPADQIDSVAVTIAG